MTYKLLLSLSYLLIFQTFSGWAQTTFPGLQQKAQLTLVDNILLSEEDQFLGTICDFIVDEEGYFYVLDQQTRSVIKYNPQGKLIQSFGNEGRGPFEFSQPARITLFKDTLFIWDASQLKLMAFTTEGKPVAEQVDFKKAVAKLGSYKNFIAMYNTGGLEGPIIEVYDIHQEKLVTTAGKKTDEHIMLMTFDGSGGFSMDGENILFTRADDPTLFQFNLATFNADTHSVSIPDFKVKTADRSAHQIINNDKLQLLNYISENSRAVNVLPLRDYYIIEAHTGTLSSSGGNPFQERIINFAVLDSSFSQIDIITLQDRRFFSSTMRYGHDNKIYNLAPDTDGSSNTYRITVWEITSN